MKRDAKFTVDEFMNLLETVKPAIGCINEETLLKFNFPETDKPQDEREPLPEPEPITKERILEILDRFTHTDTATNLRCIPVSWKDELANAIISLVYRAGK